MTYPPLPGFGNQPASGNMLARGATDFPPSTILNRGLKIVEPVCGSNYTPPIHHLTHPSNPSPNFINHCHYHHLSPPPLRHF
ncbi:hypothetical protein BDZ91DRAFT_156638 [Kalaharituber pfeilii]|nr:hypothetical protein BDZ91DRAFT_156638 [Kalaharituber pfeilii]